MEAEAYLKMADTSREADIRGLNINKLATGFADEVMVMKKFVRTAKTNARELRWYKKTAGFLDSTDTTDITASQIQNTSFGSLPVVVEASWTRTTSYVRKYMVESPTFTIEDLKDNDVDVLATNVRDLVKAVSNQVDIRIYNVISDTVTSVPADGSDVPSGAATADGWDDADTGDPILDILNAKESIRTYRYNPEGAVMALHPGDYTSLITYLINVKGSSIPGFSSEKVKSGVVHEILGVRVIVNTSFTEDYAVLWLPSTTAVWKSFTPITTATLYDPGIGKKIRVWEEGECLLENPNSAYVISDIKVA